MAHVPSLTAVHAERAQLPGGVFGDKVYVCLGYVLEGFGVVVVPFDVEPDFAVPFESMNSAAYADERALHPVVRNIFQGYGDVPPDVVGSGLLPAAVYMVPVHRAESQTNSCSLCIGYGDRIQPAVVEVVEPFDDLCTCEVFVGAHDQSP